MITEVYDAFLAAGAPADKAAKAAEAVASYDNRLNKIETELTVIKWMLGANLTLTTAVIVKLFAG